MTKILVIEDEKSVRENILEVLDAEGFEAVGAENGRIGVQLASEHIPHLILCDVMMPEIDGYGVLEALRQDPATATIPFIFMTAKATKADLRQGMELGADDYLTKPFTISELLGAIATRLRKQAAIQDNYNTTLNKATETLNYLVHYDSLTNLPNAQLLRERLCQVLTQANPNQQIVPILCIGLDRFNRINNSMGFAFGDLLLKAVAERLTTCIGGNDTLGRLNTDQFAIILVTINQKQDAANFAQIILDVLSQPFKVNGYEVFITASIGIAFYSGDSGGIDTSLKQADGAMHDAKRQGGNNYQFYTNKINLVSSDPLALEADLRHVLERAELEVYYQPQVNLCTGQIVGAEALLRWHHPERGMVSPATFIPLAEETGLIIPIGEWVLRTACAQTKAWQTVGFSYLRVAVNLSAYQFNQPNLIEKIDQILAETNFNPELLELELTESIIVHNPEAAIEIFNELKLLKIQISIDDFGTGYSSLGYLQQFPFDILKIDQCFVRNITHNTKNAIITTALIQLAHGLNLKVIAEGVETEAEQAFLCQHNCDAMQGYLFSRPLPAAEFEKLLIEGKRLPTQMSRKT
ncbi:MAG: EAL domain-containing protein [Aphanothece sp. CMT-3BRIN-NPC111]|jgi:diguanylate cyclase (GGDEF)-like protein|nr:EAL domain-containing protein [Aphanothece sp. CMT-3BRIN-NPC111]